MNEPNQPLINELAFEFWEDLLLEHSTVRALIIAELHNCHWSIIAAKRWFTLQVQIETQLFSCTLCSFGDEASR